jgi:hypothetical protein
MLMRKNDYLLLLFLLFMAGMGYLLHGHATTTDAKILIVQHGQTIIQKINLQNIKTATELKIPTEHGQMIVNVDNDGAYVVSSPCRDKLCVHQGKITRPGQTIVCLPEEVLLTLITPGKESAIDAIIR